MVSQPSLRKIHCHDALLRKPWMTVLTFGEVGPCGRDGDPDRQRTTIELVRRSEGADNESPNGKDRRECDHCVVKLCVRTEAGEESRLGMFAEERTKSFIANPARFYPILSEVARSRWGTFETRQA